MLEHILLSLVIQFVNGKQTASQQQLIRMLSNWRNDGFCHTAKKLLIFYLHVNI